MSAKTGPLHPFSQLGSFLGYFRHPRESGDRVKTIFLRRVTAFELIHPRLNARKKDSEPFLATGCFSDHRVIEAPPGEEAAANLIRVHHVVLPRTGFPRTEALLRDSAFAVAPLTTDEAALIDGGLSCMSLRFSLSS